jgi:hypothetical protein
MKNIFAIASVASLLAACTIEGGPDPIQQRAEEDAKACQNVTCGGHGKCEGGIDRNEAGEIVTVPRCYCDDGFLRENENELSCIARTNDTEGWGFRFDADSDEVTAKELRGLQGDWFYKIGNWWTDSKTDEVVTSSISINPPQYAGIGSWRAKDLVQAQRGQVTFEKPDTDTVKIGAPLTGDLAGFRPMEITKGGKRDSSTRTLLYKLSTDVKNESALPSLEVIFCPDVFTSGVSRPKIDQCVKSESRAQVPRVYIHPMFDVR